MVVCRQLGFDQQGITYVTIATLLPACIYYMSAIQRTTYCRSNCFGRTTNFRGWNNVECTGNEVRLVDCPAKREETMGCNYVGVTCGKCS